MNRLRSIETWGWVALLVIGVAAPFVVYPVFAMNVLCLALFASAFNLLLGYTGLLSFGHAAFLGSAAYVAGYAARSTCPNGEWMARWMTRNPARNAPKTK